MRDLRARLRDIVQRDGGPRELTYVPALETPPRSGGDVADALGATVLADGQCLVIDRGYPGDRSHGRRAMSAFAPTGGAPLGLCDRRLTGMADWHRHVVYFDIETTGLSGGAGT